MLLAATEEEARRQIAFLPHVCGDSTFAAPMTRSHDEHGLWLVFRGTCSRCGGERELRFHAKAPPGREDRSVGDPASARISGREEQDLYGVTVSHACTACEGKGEYFGATGDGATGMVRCGLCAGSGRVTPTLH